MIKSDVICPRCKSAYRRIELKSKPWTAGEFRCRSCDQLLETFDGTANVTVPSAKRHSLRNAISGWYSGALYQAFSASMLGNSMITRSISGVALVLMNW